MGSIGLRSHASPVLGLVPSILDDEQLVVQSVPGLRLRVCQRGREGPLAVVPSGGGRVGVGSKAAALFVRSRQCAHWALRVVGLQIRPRGVGNHQLHSDT